MREKLPETQRFVAFLTFNDGRSICSKWGWKSKRK
ncbi:hypothetical protein P368_03410 [Comamonas thiooxydans]|nr:hypothetical protein P368_03410 [Comamonas thiooxydans]